MIQGQSMDRIKAVLDGLEGWGSLLYYLMEL